MKSIRLDKYLADMGIGSRTQVKSYIKKGLIQVNHEIIKKSDSKVYPDKDTVLYENNIIFYTEHEYYMLNKPAGYVSATVDNLNPTVVELIKGNIKKDIFPVGRLDKDTEGLLLLTNDGGLAHRLLSPKNHIEKTYYAMVEGKVTEADVLKFEQGLDIGEDKSTLPSRLKVLNQPENQEDNLSEIEITIYEGKFHQVKRMFQAVGKRVVYLKRLSMAGICLDAGLEPGRFRKLSKEELSLIKQTAIR